MHGTIKTFLPDKQYGFIKGNDGKDYFFTQNAFADKRHRSQLYDGALVVFEPTATPRGYKAIQCQLLDSATIDTYIVPDEFQISKSASIRDWEIVELGDWILHASSDSSLDDAKRILIKRAQSIHANAIVNLEYDRGTGSSGNYQYSIHYFQARPAVVAKKNPQGTLRKQDLCILNQSAAAMKQDYADRRYDSKDFRHLLSILIAGLVAAFMLMMKFIGTWDASLAETLTVITIILLFIINYVPDRSDWLVRNEIKEKP